MLTVHESQQPEIIIIIYDAEAAQRITKIRT